MEYWTNENGVDRKLSQKEIQEIQEMKNIFSKLPPPPEDLRKQLQQLRKEFDEAVKILRTLEKLLKGGAR